MARAAEENIPLNKRSFKVILCGGCGVGKTSIYTRLKDEHFEDIESKTVLPDQCIINLTTNKNVEVKVTLWDTAGLEKFDSVTHSYFSDSHLVLIVYSTDKKESLVQAVKYKNEASNHALGAHLVLVQNKIDLNDSAAISEQEVKSFLKNNDFKLSFKVSAKTGDGIKEMKKKLADHLHKYGKKCKKKSGTVNLENSQTTTKKCCRQQ
ncbi:ras-related protein RabC-like [Actinia tenebrosa]|uniref:Ras-related protein RabC-like n=1 Tax=Actinia tenebrosa TaxID=6105 RepID=A0A6P8IGE4_ACTTE|nr:ras-related protein RabC-like [Actinia tenebrosa]